MIWMDGGWEKGWAEIELSINSNHLGMLHLLNMERNEMEWNLLGKSTEMRILYTV